MGFLRHPSLAVQTQNLLNRFKKFPADQRFMSSPVVI